MKFTFTEDVDQEMIVPCYKILHFYHKRSFFKLFKYEYDLKNYIRLRQVSEKHRSQIPIKHVLNNSHKFITHEPNVAVKKVTN